MVNLKYTVFAHPIHFEDIHAIILPDNVTLGGAYDGGGISLVGLEDQSRDLLR